MIQSINQAGGGQGGGATDEKVKVSLNDTTEGYLNGKLVAGSGITLTENNNGGNETLTVASSVVNTDEVVKVSSNDTTAGYLNGKLVAGTNITLTENNNGSNETLTITAASGVTGFTSSQNTASPNNTVNASRLLVDATSTNADAVIQPKGTGALLAQLPDGAVTGGNKRGANALDLQTERAAASQVASGTRAIVIGGRENTASGLGSMAIGEGCSATANNAFAMGRSSTASALDTLALGRSATANNQNAICLSGESTGSAASGVGSISIGCDTLASSSRAVAIGFRALSNRFGMYSYSNGTFNTRGDCQYERYILRRETTTATQTELSCDGSAPGADTRIGIANDSTYTFTAFVTARRTDADNESAGYKIEGVIDNNAGTTAFVGTPTVTVLAEDTAAWDVVVEADNTNDALVIKVTGETGKTIRWGAVVELMKVSG